MLTVPPAVKLWYCPDPVDMRLGFDGLFALVRNRLDAFGGLFTGFGKQDGHYVQANPRQGPRHAQGYKVMGHR